MGRVTQYQCDVQGCEHKSKDPTGWWAISGGKYNLQINSLVTMDELPYDASIVCGMVCLHKKISELLGESNGKSH